MRNILLLTTTLITLAACGASGQPFSPSSVGANEASVIIYKTQTYGFTIGFTANGVDCKVKAGGYMPLTVPAGQSLTLRHRSLGDPYPSEMTITPKAGARYYVRVQSNDDVISPLGVAAVVGGGIVGHAAVSQEGTFVFREGNEAEALTTKQGGLPCQL